MPNLRRWRRIETSEWASALVVVPKPNGKARITGDFKRTVNSQLCVSQYPLADQYPLEDLLGTIAGHQHSSWTVPVQRVTPGDPASSPAIFQELMDKMLYGIPMTGGYIDEVISSGQVT
jgi:hypothetical protein